MRNYPTKMLIQYDDQQQVFMNPDTIDLESKDEKQQIGNKQQTQKAVNVLPLAQKLDPSLTECEQSQKIIDQKQSTNSQQILKRQHQIKAKPDQRLQLSQKQAYRTNIARNLVENSAALEKITHFGQQPTKLLEQLQSIQLTRGKQIDSSHNNFLERSTAQVVSQTQFIEGQTHKAEDSNQFFMSIRSEQSQIAILDQQGQKLANKQELERPHNDLPSVSGQFKIFGFKNQSRSEDEPQSSSSQNENPLNCQNKLLASQKITERRPANEVDESKQISQSGTALEPAFINTVTQQIKIQTKKQQRIKNQNQIQQPRVELFSMSQKKLNYVSCNINVAIDKQSIIIQAEELNKSQVLSSKSQSNQIRKNEGWEVKRIQAIQSKAQVKVQPLDIKTLSVLTLSSPQGIKSIKPPSPKAEGRVLKPWEKLKKLKSNNDSVVSTPSISRNFSTITQQADNASNSTIMRSSQIVQKKSQPPLNAAKQKLQTQAVNANAQGQNEQPRLSNLQNTDYKSMQIEQKKITSQILKPEQSLQQLKKNYSYIGSVIEPVNSEASVDNKQYSIVNDQKQSKRDQSPASIVKEQDNLSSNVLQRKDQLIHEQPKNHPLLRHYPAQFKILQKEQALVDDSKISNRQSEQNKRFQPQAEAKIFQIAAQSVLKEEGLNSELQEINLKSKLSSKKSAGSQIINDSSFEAKNSQKSIEIKKRLQQLQLQIQRQKKINKDLEVTSTFEGRLLLSFLAVLAAGGISLLLRKDKLSSILLALATGVSTFILKK